MNERQIFEAALEIQEADRRQLFLDRACGQDAALRQRLETLLASHAADSQFLNVPAAQQLQVPPDTSGEDTLQLPPGGVPQEDDSSDDEISNGPDLSFLEPSTKPGSIGVLGHYEILHILGQGAFGIVFKAFDEKLHRHVAIKTMTVQMAATSPPRKRFLREARAAAAIRHDNVVQVYSVEEQPIPYLVMEFIDGQTLQQKQRNQGPFEVPELLHIARQITSGLAAAHSMSLIHRDIKPGNILLETGVEQKVKITDFGLARAADDASLTRSGMISGTPLYMAPEQAMGQTMDHRSDLFSLGSVLYELATGRPPFRAPNTIAVLKRVVDDQQRPMREIIPEIPDWLVTIVNKLLEKKPADRYQSAKEVADLLARCQSELQLTGQVQCVPASNPVSGAASPPGDAATLATSEGLRPPLAVDLTGASSQENQYPRPSHWPVILSLLSVLGIVVATQMLEINKTLSLAFIIVAMVFWALVGGLQSFLFKKRLQEIAQGTPAASPPKKLTPTAIIFALLLGVLMMSPILFGKHLSGLVNSWLWPAIPTLPVVDRAAGLQFDGKDDYVQIPVDWSYPQFTIEAFVTSAPGSDNGNIVHLSGGGKVPEWMGLNDGPPAPAGERVSGAQILGKTPYASAYAPFVGGVRQHRALVFDGSRMHYYVNGIWQGERRAAPRDAMLWKMQELRLGSGSDGKRFFEGQIDQLRVSKVARYASNFPPVTSVAADDATLALYNFEEGTGDVLKDVSGNNNDGKIYGATWVHSANGLQFDGVDDSVEINGLGWNSNQYTIEAYISQDGEHGNLFQTVGPGGMLHMYLNPLAGGVGINRDDVYKNINCPRPALVRQHLALVYDGQHLNYFVQGQLVGTKPNVSAGATPMPLDRMIIGTKVALDPSKPEFFEGRLEQFRVSKTVRYTGPFTPVHELTADDATLALYDFAQGTGDVLKDISGNGHDGKIVGATWVMASGAASAPRDVATPTNSEGSRPPLAKTGWHGWPADAPAPAIAPFTTEQAKAHQEAWAKYLGVPVEYTNSIGMKFRLIPPGEFTMGSTPEEIESALKVAGENRKWQEFIRSEGPQHKVILTKPIYVGVTEVTQSQFEQVMGTNPSGYSATGPGKDVVADIATGILPVEMVSWNDAAEFCAKLSRQEQLKPFPAHSGDTETLGDVTSYRLPSEAEWEFACRGGSMTRFWNGDEQRDLMSTGWFTINADRRTHATGELIANPFGLSDMHGNVGEFVQDGWDSEFYTESQEHAAIDPLNPYRDGFLLVVRGGWLWNDHVSCSSSTRANIDPSDRFSHVGFRVVVPVDAVKEVIKRNPESDPKLGQHVWPADAPAPAIAPFDAEQAKAHQEAWAKYLGVPVEYTNSIGMKFRLIPPGEFLMGSTPDEIKEALKFAGDAKVWQEYIESETPQHTVILTQPIYLGVFEVTQAEYEKVMGVNPSHFAPTGNGKEAVAGLETAEHPVEMVSWNDAAEFCARLSQQEKLNPFYFRGGETITPLDGTGYRLPSEAEWEFACRAGTTTKYWTGDKDEDLVQAGWLDRNSGERTHAAGELKANPFGLFDIHGNVWERVQDGWDATYYGQFSEEAVINPSNPFSAGSLSVIRGGNWQRNVSTCRSSKRNDNGTTTRDSRIGFRAVLSVDAVKASLVKQAPVSEVKTGWHGWPADAPLPAIAPFDAAQAQAHQEAWAQYLNLPAEYTNSIGMKFMLIPPGEFTMGSTAEEIEAALKQFPPEEIDWQGYIRSEAPQHQVILTRPIYLGVNEVTQSDYEKVMGSNPSRFSPMGMGKEAVAGLETAEYPVETVSWNDAAEFCAKLSQQEKFKPFYFRNGETVTPLKGTGYRLPSEAEWEFACRAGTTTKYWSGDRDEDLIPAGWFVANSGGRTHAAGELNANPFGLYDIHGNVCEWVQDGWDANWYGQFQEKPAMNPNMPFFTGSKRVLRGGDWTLIASTCRSSGRDVDAPTNANPRVGFRVSLPVDAVRTALQADPLAVPLSEANTPAPSSDVDPNPDYDPNPAPNPNFNPNPDTGTDTNIEADM